MSRELDDERRVRDAIERLEPRVLRGAYALTRRDWQIVRAAAEQALDAHRELRQGGDR